MHLVVWWQSLRAREGGEMISVGPVVVCQRNKNRDLFTSHISERNAGDDAMVDQLGPMPTPAFSRILLLVAV